MRAAVVNRSDGSVQTGTLGGTTRTEFDTGAGFGVRGVVVLARITVGGLCGENCVWYHLESR